MPSSSAANNTPRRAVRLNKAIADSGLCSRRSADQWIQAGRVQVNGQRVTTLGAQVDPGTDEIRVDGKPLARPRTHYLAFYKPKDCITSRADEKGRKTIYDYLPETLHSVDPAGRLDRNTTGLLLLSNDGSFIHQVSHPRFAHEKHYWVEVKGPLDERALEKLKQGVRLLPENQTAKAVDAAFVGESQTAKGTPLFVYLVVLVTGYNRQVRRMFEQVGATVVNLKRIQFGPVKLGTMHPGQIRPLNKRELSALGWTQAAQNAVADRPGQRPGSRRNKRPDIPKTGLKAGSKTGTRQPAAKKSAKISTSGKPGNSKPASRKPGKSGPSGGSGGKKRGPSR